MRNFKTKTMVTMKNRKIIGFAGRKRSGKTELSKCLREEENAVIITIANYLKYLCCDLLNVDFEKLIQMKDDDTQIELNVDERFCKLINKRTGIEINDIIDTMKFQQINNVREMLQIIGTDLIRKFCPNWHIDNMLKDIESFSDDKLIVIDDVRFPNEKLAIENLGGEVFFIIRPTYLNVSNHESEISLKWQNFPKDHIIINDCSVEELRLHFLLKYRNDFNIKIGNGIFLHENEWCFPEDMEVNFPFNCNDETVISALVKHLKTNNRFNKIGLITYKTSDYRLGKLLNQYLYNTNKFKGDYIIYNPLIVENLKMYL